MRYPQHRLLISVKHDNKVERLPAELSYAGVKVLHEIKLSN